MYPTLCLQISTIIIEKTRNYYYKETYILTKISMPPFLNYIFLPTSNICFCQQLFPQQSHQQEQKQSLQIQFHQVLICWGSIELCKLTLIRVNHLSWFLPAGTGSKSTPSPGDGSSSGNSIKLSIPLLLILAAATHASVFWTYWFFNQLATHLKCYFFFCLLLPIVVV